MNYTPPIDQPISPAADSSITPDQSLSIASRNHLENIRRSFLLVEDALLNDLAKLYRLKAAGQPVQIPTEVTIKDVLVRLS